MAYQDITLEAKGYFRDWAKAPEKIDKVTLMIHQSKLENQLVRCEDYTRVLLHVVEDEDSGLTEAQLDAFDAALHRLLKVERWLRDCVEVLDEATERWDKLYEDIEYVLCDDIKTIAKS